MRAVAVARERLNSTLSSLVAANLGGENCPVPDFGHPAHRSTELVESAPSHLLGFGLSTAPYATAALRGPSYGPSGATGPPAMLLIASTTVQRQASCRLLRRDRRCWTGDGGRGGAHVAAGDVERGQGRIGILRQAAAPGLDQVRLRKTGLRGAAVAQHLRGTAQFARQHDQGTVEVDPWADDLDRPRDPERRGG